MSRMKYCVGLTIDDLTNLEVKTHERYPSDAVRKTYVCSCSCGTKIEVPACTLSDKRKLGHN